jgi:hypothetical protein
MTLRSKMRSIIPIGDFPLPYFSRSESRFQQAAYQYLLEKSLDELK